jgi:hypothetical protein
VSAVHIFLDCVMLISYVNNYVYKAFYSYHKKKKKKCKFLPFNDIIQFLSNVLSNIESSETCHREISKWAIVEQVSSDANQIFVPYWLIRTRIIKKRIKNKCPLRLWHFTFVAREILDNWQDKSVLLDLGKMEREWLRGDQAAWPKVLHFIS